MFYAGLILAMQTVIAWRVFQNGERITEAINLLGDIKMKQEEFDRKVNALNEKVTGLDSKLDGEAGEIAKIVSDYKDEIQRLKDSQGDNIDTSRLDELSNSLDSVGTRIGGLVDPLPTGGETPPIGAPAPQTPAEPVDPIQPTEELPAESIGTDETAETETTGDEDASAEKPEE